MASSISAGTTSATALVHTADTSGALELKTNNGTTALTLSAAQVATFAGTLTTAAKGITATSLPAGSVLQVLSTTKTDTFSTSSASFTDITGLSVSITPTSATSKILVMASLCGGVNGGTNAAQYRLVRGSTAIAIADAAGSRTQSTSALNYQIDANRIDSYTFQTLDSPATTSATTYKVQIITSASTAYINRSFNDTDNAVWGRTVSTITVMEVAA